MISSFNECNLETTLFLHLTICEIICFDVDNCLKLKHLICYAYKNMKIKINCKRENKKNDNALIAT